MKRILLVQAALLSTLFISSIAYSDTVISVSTPGPLSTSDTGNIEITDTGQVINLAGNAIELNAADTTVTIDANNGPYGSNAVEASNIGINITASGTVTVGGGGSGITSNGGSTGIYATALADIINNGGTIQGNGNGGVFLDVGSDGSQINNNSGGIILDNNGFFGMNISGTDLNLTNNGVGSSISGSGGSGIVLASTASGATIINIDGALITDTNGFFGINASGPGLNLTNEGVDKTGAISTISGNGSGGIILASTASGATIINIDGALITDTGGNFGISAAGANLNIRNAGVDKTSGDISSISGSGGGGIILASTASGATIINESGALITDTGTNTAIIVNGAGLNLTNEGAGTKIVGTGAGGILLNASAANTTIQNYTGGLITDTSGAGGIIVSNGATSTFIGNTGGSSITSIGGQGIYTNAAGVTISNDGVGSKISGTGSGGIYIDSNASSTNIENSNGGLITDPNTAISVNNGAITTTITNNAGASITSTANGPTIYHNTNGATIINSGTISNTSNSVNPEAIFLDVNSANVTIQNNSTGLITSTGAVYTIRSNLSVGTNLINDGVISASSVSLGAIDGSYQTIQNNSNGLIIGSNAIATVGANLINNSGTIIGNGGVGYAAVFDLNTLALNNNVGGLISGVNGSDAILTSINFVLNNSGTVQSDTGYAINLFDGPATWDIFNGSTGAILVTNPGKAAIFVLPAAIAPITITNAGAITVPSGTAIDLSAMPGGNYVQGTLVQNGGTITGDIRLAPVAETFAGIFTMNGGTVNGDIYTTNNGTPGLAQILTLNAGTINGFIQLNTQNDTTINLVGTTISGAIERQGGTDIINVTGGSFEAITNTAGGTGTLNINRSFTILASNISGVDFINVNNAGTVFKIGATVNTHAVTTIHANTTMTLDPDFIDTGPVTNAGTLNLPLNNTLTASTYTATNSSNTQFELNANPGAIIVTAAAPGAATFNVGSIITPTGSFLPGIYDVVFTEGAASTIVDHSTLSLSTLGRLTFHKATIGSPGAEILQITISGSTFVDIVGGNPWTQGVANTINLLQLYGMQGLAPMIYQLNSEGTNQEVEAALESLTPDASYALAELGMLGLNVTFQGIQAKQINAAGRRYAHNLSYGDGLSPAYDVWIDVLGGNVKQNPRQFYSGYHGAGVGTIIGADFDLSDCASFGIAGSYIKFNASTQGLSPKSQEVKSVSGAVYGWYAFTERFFVDAMLGVSSEQFDTNRTINVGAIHTGANAEFFGVEYGALADIGYAWVNNGQYFVAPIVRVKYLLLALDDYTELGVDPLNLTVNNKTLNELAGGVGLRFASLYEKSTFTFEPEAAVYYLYDFMSDAQQSFANFAGGGISFETYGMKPGRDIGDLELSLNVYSKDWVMNFTYDLEVRDRFISNIGYLQFTYMLENLL